MAFFPRGGCHKERVLHGHQDRAMCYTLFLTSFSGGRGQEKKCFLTSCKECLLHGQGQQEQPMCKYNHGKEYSNSKNPKMTPIELSHMLLVLIAVQLFHLFQYCLY